MKTEARTVGGEGGKKSLLGRPESGLRLGGREKREYKGAQDCGRDEHEHIDILLMNKGRPFRDR